MDESLVKFWKQIIEKTESIKKMLSDFSDGLHKVSTEAIADNTNALVDLGDVTEGNNSDSESALAELADMITALDERITALEAKGE